jgi:hypothetical protein
MQVSERLPKQLTMNKEAGDTADLEAGCPAWNKFRSSELNVHAMAVSVVASDNNLMK